MSVYTKSHEEGQQWVWSSSVGSHQYTIKEDDDAANKMVRGTRVVLHLKVKQDVGVCVGVVGWREGGSRGRLRVVVVSEVVV